MMSPKLLPIVLMAIAPTSLSLGTNVGTIAERTGLPNAIKIPEMQEPTMAHRMVIASKVIIMAIATVMKSAPIWLMMRSVRRFMWSLITPTGSEMRSAGRPMTKRMSPLISDFAPRPRASHTNAKRWVL